jgi:hypothetical protein
MVVKLVGAGASFFVGMVMTKKSNAASILFIKQLCISFFRPNLKLNSVNRYNSVWVS